MLLKFFLHQSQNLWLTIARLLFLKWNGHVQGCWKEATFNSFLPINFLWFIFGNLRGPFFSHFMKSNRQILPLKSRHFKASISLPHLSHQLIISKEANEKADRTGNIFFLSFHSWTRRFTSTTAHQTFWSQMKILNTASDSSCMFHCIKYH